jgi:hypothetical protein
VSVLAFIMLDKIPGLAILREMIGVSHFAVLPREGDTIRVDRDLYMVEGIVHEPQSGEDARIEIVVRPL